MAQHEMGAVGSWLSVLILYLNTPTTTHGRFLLTRGPHTGEDLSPYTAALRHLSYQMTVSKLPGLSFSLERARVQVVGGLGLD